MVASKNSALAQLGRCFYIGIRDVAMAYCAGRSEPGHASGGMNISAPANDTRVADVRCTDDDLIVDLMDGRTISVPLAWYLRLASATPEQRAEWVICGGGYSDSLAAGR